MVHITKSNDPIEVLVIFKKHRAEPFSFKWGGRKYAIEKVNLVHAQNTGSGKQVSYSVMSNDTYFKIVFDTNEMLWHLEEVYCE